MSPQIDLFVDPSVGTVPGPRALDRQKKLPLPDDPARERIEKDLKASLFVEAAAGAGKTTALVRRLVAIVGAGKGTLERMVAVTFTDKAAGEMKLRLRTAIEEARREADDPGVRARYDEAVRQLEVARIGTIHSFCADLLRERPVEAGVDPNFQVLPEDQSGRLLDRAFQAWFEEALADPPEGVARVLRRPPERTFGGGRRGPRQELRDAAQLLADHRDFPAAWSRPEGFDHGEAIDRGIELLRELAAFDMPGPEPRQWIAKGFRKIARFVEGVDLREEAEPRDPDRLEAEIRELRADRKAGWTYSGSGEWYDRSRGLRLEDVKARRDEAVEALDELLESCEADLAARLREELRPAVAGYEELKRREGALDFLDLLLRARDLVVRDAGVRRELQRRFTHFFVDEFQDTDPLQAEILLLLASDDPEETDFRRARPVPGKLFLVGDPKQSIYSFRRADVRIYEETKRRLLQRGTELVRLTTSFRSVPGIQETVNAAFSEWIRPAEDGSQAAYVPLERFRGETPGQPSLVALPAPVPYSDWGRVVKWKVSESYADAVGAFIQWLVEESGWTVTEPGRPDAPVRLRPRHICILSRRLQSRYEEVMEPYVRALEARGVPHVLVGGKGFHDREEIQALRNALQAVEWPDDALSVYGTLRGPFFALTDGELLAFRERVGSLHPLHAATDRAASEGRKDGDAEAEAGPEDAVAGEEDPVAVALGILAELHGARNRRPIAQTLTRFLDACRAHAGIAIWPAGEQALANCLRLVDRARTFERGGASSFRAFVEMLEEEAERGEVENAPIVEEGTQGVRIMSVHRAKGLEFPVVILADPTCNATLSKPSRHVDPERGLWAEKLCGAVPPDVLDHREEEAAREEAEAVRLAYVAATRARDLLVVPGVGDGEELEGWAQYLNPAIYPDPAARRRPEPADELGCPPFGDDTVVNRPPRADGRPEDAVKPGLHASRAGPSVVWWDPAALELGKQEAVGLRQQEILAADEEGTVSEAGIRAHEEWRARRAETLAAGAEPSVRVRTVRQQAAELAESPARVGTGRDEATTAEAAERPAGPGSGPEPQEEALQEELRDDVEVQLLEVPRPVDEARPGGVRFGELVHRVLATVALDAELAEARLVVEGHARALGASSEERDAAAALILRVLEHPLLRRAAACQRAGSLRRETPLFATEPDGSITEGVPDLAFREPPPAGQKSQEAQTAGSAPADVAGATWTVVDFKTDREVAGERAAYEEQVRLYARALRRATGEPARGVLLVV